MAEARRGRRTLVVSTDPAPSLGDALGIPLGNAPRRIPVPRGDLRAVEIDARQAFARWFRTRRPVLETITLRGTWLDRTDVETLFDLSPPGLDEIAALLEVLRYCRAGRYDAIVIDTAPTGHTLRLLAMPETMAGIARAFAAMDARHRMVAEALRGVPLDDDGVIRELERDARAFRDLLRDPVRTHVSLVSLPEPLAVEETLDFARYLHGAGIPLARVIVNRLTAPPPDPCGWCTAKRRAERRAVSRLAAGLRALAAHSGGAVPLVAGVSEREREPAGVAALAGLAPALERALPVRASPAREAPQRGRTARLRRGVPCTPFDASLKLLMFGGKGGVGKTTCAAAAALELARAEPDRRVLLVSVDPAHSLSDALRTRLSDAPRSVPGGPRNLEARELDAPRAFAALGREYAHAVDALFDRIGRGSSFDLSQDRRVLQDLLNLAPPGLDEIAAVLRVIDLLGVGETAPRYDTLIVDTAPTGHALRLLETPATIQLWARALMAIVLKYQPVAGIGELGAALLRLSRSLSRLRKMLVNPGETHFVIVTRLAALPRAETRRLHLRLRRLGVAVPFVIVNAMGAGVCRRCRRTLRAQERESASLAVRRGAAGRPPLIAAPATVPPPAGVDTLVRWRRAWRCFER